MNNRVTAERSGLPSWVRQVRMTGWTAAAQSCAGDLAGKNSRQFETRVKMWRTGCGAQSTSLRTPRNGHIPREASGPVGRFRAGAQARASRPRTGRHSQGKATVESLPVEESDVSSNAVPTWMPKHARGRPPASVTEQKARKRRRA